MFKRSVLSVGAVLLAIVACLMSFGFQGAGPTGTMSNAYCDKLANGCGCMVSSYASPPSCTSQGTYGCFITSCSYEATMVTVCSLNFNPHSSCLQSGNNTVSCSSCGDVFCGSSGPSGSCGTNVMNTTSCQVQYNDPCSIAPSYTYVYPPSCVLSTSPGNP